MVTVNLFLPVSVLVLQVSFTYLSVCRLFCIDGFIVGRRTATVSKISVSTSLPSCKEEAAFPSAWMLS